MKFTVLGHACMHIECDGKSLMTDPWLYGSCYWRSWWPYPELSQEKKDYVDQLKVDYVYLTHLHWDHFHGVTLRRLKKRNPNLKVFVPKIHSTKMIDDLKYCDIDDPIEIPHGTSVQLGQNFSLHSYQFDISTDSCAIITDGKTTLFDVNDCKVFGSPLKSILGKFPKIDFVFRQHSSATSIPYCIDDYKTSFPSMRPPEDYIKDFFNFALHVNARYAIPFASNHCFLHRDTIKFNKTGVSPEKVRKYFERSGIDPDKNRCVVMTPGSAWSDKDGFELVDFDYMAVDETISGMLEKHKETLNNYYIKESETLFDESSFRNYFDNLFNDIPSFLLRKTMTVDLKVIGKERVYVWRINFKGRSYKQVDKEDLEINIVIEMPTTIINDCVKYHMFNVLGPSKRLRIVLPHNSNKELAAAQKALSLFSWYDQGYFPLRRNFSLRSIGVRLRRWRDIYQFILVIFKYKVCKRPLIISELWPAVRGRK